MSTLKFKTNINCTGCLSKVSPLLNQESEIKAWNVDLDNENKILTVETLALTAEEIKLIVAKAGFSVIQDGLIKK